MAYSPFPLPKAIEIWTAAGGQVYELIEPVDGYARFPFYVFVLWY
jgi:hypothetical protein